MAFDPMRIAQQIVDKKEQQPSLVPIMPSAPDIPDRPVYVVPKQEQFNWEVPMSERPRGTEDWIWTKTMRAKEDWNAEQARKAQDVYNKYSADLAAWQDAIDIANRRYDQEAALVRDYYGQQGLIAPLAGDPTPIIRQAHTQWQLANEAGNRAGMDYWHDIAEQARIGAGWGTGGIDGSLTAGYMTSAGLPSWERQFRDTQYQDTLAQYQDALKHQQWERDFAERQLAQNYALSSARAASSASGEVKPTQTDRYNAAKGEAIQAVNDAILSGKSASFIEERILQSAPELTRDGVDYQGLLEYLEEMYPALSPNAAREGEVAERERLRDRPLYQRIIDGIIPGKQFR